MLFNSLLFGFTICSCFLIVFSESCSMNINKDALESSSYTIPFFNYFSDYPSYGSQHTPEYISDQSLLCLEQNDRKRFNNELDVNNEIFVEVTSPFDAYDNEDFYQNFMSLYGYYKTNLPELKEENVIPEEDPSFLKLNLFFKPDKKISPYDNAMSIISIIDYCKDSIRTSSSTDSYSSFPVLFHSIYISAYDDDCLYSILNDNINIKNTKLLIQTLKEHYQFNDQNLDFISSYLHFGIITNERIWNDYFSNTNYFSEDEECSLFLYDPTPLNKNQYQSCFGGWNDPSYILYNKMKVKENCPIKHYNIIKNIPPSMEEDDNIIQDYKEPIFYSILEWIIEKTKEIIPNHHNNDSKYVKSMKRMNSNSYNTNNKLLAYTDDDDFGYGSNILIRESAGFINNDQIQCLISNTINVGISDIYLEIIEKGSLMSPGGFNPYLLQNVYNFNVNNSIPLSSIKYFFTPDVDETPETNADMIYNFFYFNSNITGNTIRLYVDASDEEYYFNSQVSNVDFMEDFRNRIVSLNSQDPSFFISCNGIITNQESWDIITNDNINPLSSYYPNLIWFNPFNSQGMSYNQIGGWPNYYNEDEFPNYSKCKTSFDLLTTNNFQSNSKTPTPSLSIGSSPSPSASILPFDDDDFFYSSSIMIHWDQEVTSYDVECMLYNSINTNTSTIIHQITKEGDINTPNPYLSNNFIQFYNRGFRNQSFIVTPDINKSPLVNAENITSYLLNALGNQSSTMYPLDDVVIYINVTNPIYWFNYRLGNNLYLEALHGRLSTNNSDLPYFSYPIQYGIMSDYVNYDIITDEIPDLSINYKRLIWFNPDLIYGFQFIPFGNWSNDGYSYELIKLQYSKCRGFQYDILQNNFNNNIFQGSPTPFPSPSRSFSSSISKSPSSSSSSSSSVSSSLSNTPSSSISMEPSTTPSITSTSTTSISSSNSPSNSPSASSSSSVSPIPSISMSPSKSPGGCYGCNLYNNDGAIMEDRTVDLMNSNSIHFDSVNDFNVSSERTILSSFSGIHLPILTPSSKDKLLIIDDTELNKIYYRNISSLPFLSNSTFIPDNVTDTSIYTINGTLNSDRIVDQLGYKLYSLDGEFYIKNTIPFDYFGASIIKSDNNGYSELRYVGELEYNRVHATRDMGSALYSEYNDTQSVFIIEEVRSSSSKLNPLNTLGETRIKTNSLVLENSLLSTSTVNSVLVRDPLNQGVIKQRSVPSFANDIMITSLQSSGNSGLLIDTGSSIQTTTNISSIPNIYSTNGELPLGENRLMSLNTGSFIIDNGDFILPDLNEDNQETMFMTVDSNNDIVKKRDISTYQPQVIGFSAFLSSSITITTEETQIICDSTQSLAAGTVGYSSPGFYDFTSGNATVTKSGVYTIKVQLGYNHNFFNTKQLNLIKIYRNGNIMNNAYQYFDPTGGGNDEFSFISIVNVKLDQGDIINAFFDVQTLSLNQFITVLPSTSFSMWFVGTI